MAKGISGVKAWSSTVYIVFKPRCSIFESEDLHRCRLGIQEREALGRGEGGKGEKRGVREEEREDEEGGGGSMVLGCLYSAPFCFKHVISATSSQI